MCWLWSAIESYLCFSHSYLWSFFFLPVSAVRFWLHVCFATNSCIGSYFTEVWMLFYCFLLVQANRKSYVDLFKFKFKQLINSCRKSGSSGSGVPPFPWPPSKSDNFMHVSLQLCWDGYVPKSPGLGFCVCLLKGQHEWRTFGWWRAPKQCMLPPCPQGAALCSHPP